MESKIFDSLLEPTFVLNKEGIVLYCNETAAQLLDLSPKKVVRSKRRIDELFRFEVSVPALGMLENITDPSPYQEVRYQTESDKAGRAQITVQKSSESAETWIVYMRDVTLEETLQKKYRRELEQKEHVILDLQKAQSELEDYSKNLELKVAARTRELSALNGQMQSLLDSLRDAFFIFDEEGRCMNISSKACLEVIECNPNGRFIWDVLKLEQHQVPGIQRWMQTCFAEMLPFEDLADLGPKKFNHSKNKEIEIAYFPLRIDGEGVHGIVCVASDITDLVAARAQAQKDRTQVNMILSLIKNRKQIRNFVDEAEGFIREVNQELERPNFDPESVFRGLHTLKGSAGILSIREMVETCHAGEDSLAAFKRTGAAADFESLRDKARKLPEHLAYFKSSTLPLVGLSLESRADALEIETRCLLEFRQHLKQASPQSLDRFDEVAFCEPMAASFEHLSENLMSLAISVNKKLNPLKIVGGELRVFKRPYQSLLDSLIHAFRNSIDHGLEYPEERIDSGKSEAGTIELQFSRDLEQNLFRIEVRDDGRGIAVEKLRAKLIERGENVHHLSDEEVLQFIFAPSVSTKDQVTELSGRGVGMDAIADYVKKLRGDYRVFSTPGQGTRLVLQVPWLKPDVGSEMPAIRDHAA